MLVFDAVHRVPGMHQQFREPVRPETAKLFRIFSHDPPNFRSYFPVVVFLHSIRQMGDIQVSPRQVSHTRCQGQDESSDTSDNTQINLNETDLIP